MTAAAQVSAIVPVFNGERYLDEALRSALDQTLPPSEVIVVDDGSTDRSGEIAESFGDPVRCIRQENLGVARARNRGLSVATGEFIAFLDHDDLWPPTKLEVQVAALRANPDVGIVTGHIRYIAGALPGRPGTGQGTRETPGTGYLQATLIRRSVFDRIGPLSEDVGGAADDLEWNMRARDLGIRRLLLDDVTALYSFTWSRCSWMIAFISGFSRSWAGSAGQPFSSQSLAHSSMSSVISATR
jgi:glycosyltransferase involved in cell wall biosynthesis